GHREHRRLEDVGVLVEGGLDLDGCDVLATPYDLVLGPVDDVQEAVGVHPTQVPGSQPPVGERLGRGLRAPPVAGHDGRSAHPDLPGLTDGHVAAGAVDDADVAHRDGDPHAGGALGVVGPADGG